ncbi:hypothetical protein GCM10009676_08490 [Prauserella halophila]|uniref:Uncharacterized protein n=1 Tax=Prauserella halophila TaxID=185641 RepID=A0ABN1VZI3_9PSEU
MNESRIPHNRVTSRASKGTFGALVGTATPGASAWVAVEDGWEPHIFPSRRRVPPAPGRVHEGRIRRTQCNHSALGAVWGSTGSPGWVRDAPHVIVSSGDGHAKLG